MHFFTLFVLAQTPLSLAAAIICEKYGAFGGIAMVTIYGITQCDTVKKARAWLSSAQIDTTFHDFKREGLADASLDAWLDAFGWERLINRAGTTWRRLDEARRARVIDKASARDLILENPSLIKRPVVVWHNGQMTLGFKPEVFEAHRPRV